MKTVIYLGNFSFPYGNAAGKRVYANGKILRDLGYRVIFIGVSKEVKMNDKLIENKGVFDSFEFYNLPYPHKSSDWLKFRKIFRMVKDLLEQDDISKDVEYIIYYGSPTLSLFNTKIINYYSKKGTKIISDCVDWLTPRTSSKLFNIVKSIDNTYQKSFANKKCDGVIVISKYLDTYYKRSNMNTVVIPPLSPIRYRGLSSKIDSNVSITYAGIPFKIGSKQIDLSGMKDRIDKIIELFALVKKNRSNFLLNIYGFLKDDYLTAIPSHEQYVNYLGENIRFHGYKKHEDIINHLKSTDFTILARDINRDTTAGFPTKISESISCGTPVLTNKSSDIDTYIIEGIHGYFINFDNIEEAVSKITKILDLSPEMINNMKRECLISDMFYYQNYSRNLKEFLKTC